MEFSNEHWRLIITPRYVRKDNQKVKSKCVHCNGTGVNYETGEDDHRWHGIGSNGPICTWCIRGEIEVLPNIPPPPEMDKKFVKDLKEWFNNYHKE
jgi:hypothetical protein